jgi:hypothetical protein
MSLARIVIFMIAVLAHGRQGEEEKVFYPCCFLLTNLRIRLHMSIKKCLCARVYSRVDGSSRFSLATAGVAGKA